jgi:hypothetical protein
MLVVGKRARQTQENYVGRVRAYLKRTGRAGLTLDEFRDSVRRRPKD